MQGPGPFDPPAEAQCLRHDMDPFRTQKLPQPDEIPVAAFFQRPRQIDLAVGDPSGAAENLSIHLAPAGTGVDKISLPCFQRSCGQHRLEHRAHRIAPKRPLHQRAALSFQTGRNVFRVIVRQADAGPDLCGVRLQHQNTAALHGLLCHCLRRLLDLPGESQLHPCRPAVVFLQLRFSPQFSLCVDGAAQGVPFPAAGQQGVKGRFQSGGPFSLAIPAADQLDGQRRVRIPTFHRPAQDSQRRDIPVHFQQKGGRRIPLPVEFRLPGGIGIREQPGIAVLPRDAERHPSGGQPGQALAAAIVEVAPPGGQGQGHCTLGRRPGRIHRVGADPEQPADHHRKPEDQRPVQSQHPPAGHETAPFLSVVWTRKGADIISFFIYRKTRN